MFGGLDLLRKSQKITRNSETLAAQIELPDGSWFKRTHIVSIEPEEGSRIFPQIGPRVSLGILRGEKVLLHSVPCRDFATAQFIAKDIAYRLGWKSV